MAPQRLTLALALVLTTAAVGTAIGGQQPRVQNGRVDVRSGASVDREIAAAGPDPVWIGWRVPMVPGERDLCSSWSNDQQYVRGAVLEPRQETSTPPAFTAPSGPVPLESGTGLVVLVRALDGRTERLRTLSDDCPIDAAGTRVVWLADITTSASLRFLETLTRVDDRLAAGDAARVAAAAVNAIGLHRDAAADAILDRLLESADPAVGRRAATVLGALRGGHGFMTLRARLTAERDTGFRRTLVSALSGTREPETAGVLLQIARTDADAAVRAEAAAGYVRRAGAAGLDNARALIQQDSDRTVRRRVISGLAALPGGAAVPLLIDLADHAGDLGVRTAAVSALTRTKDPRADAFLQSVVAR
jgi:hypothetical protein